MKASRRTVLKGAAALAAPSFISAARANKGAVEDEAYWREVAKAYDVKKDIVNLENGNWGVMARPVTERYFENLKKVNHDNSYYARRAYGDDYRAIHAELASFLGAGEDEIALTRGATEALKALITRYNRLKPGDAVMYADLDYGSMQAMMDWRAAQSGCAVVKVSIPEPSTHDGLVAFYKKALADNPSVKLLLLTHISHRTGLAIPVKKIVAEARKAGVDCIVDAAHSWGQMNFTADDLGADFVGYNLHKWIGAPIGVGLAYIKKGRLNAIDPDPGAGDWEQTRISGRIHTGTSDFAAVLTLPEALKFGLEIGPALKAERLAYLRNLWVEAARGLPDLQILTPDDPRLHAGITSFRLEGKTSVEDNVALVERLLSEFNIFTVHRDGVAAGTCVRVTPTLYNTPQDSLALAKALKTMAS
ncbi:aminotransferase class V-fold PLP-dependent enzyme [Hyphococcus luteus]|uniref:Aminotransferase n=1 Tax=Hyphococcus luteus TaxID=2058213 RepID=A0A2S7K460_9PROT|nr:aminotransferase class V-fold PLP-dependent enzyme [Marinicaulis flavus]PQA87287.1 aminotransferase [Marinicaulis flavus]